MINNYRLYNSDCIKILKKLKKDNFLIDAIITDPPYNISKENNLNTLNNANDLIKANVNNDNVWNSDTSSAFMVNWTKYAENNFPTYISTFETQIRNINTALETYTSAEM